MAVVTEFPMDRLITPVLFLSNMERPEPDEARTIAGLDDTMRDIRETTFAHTGHADRSVHAKAHGILYGTLTVPEAVPAPYAQGLFAGPGQYRTVLRLSTQNAWSSAAVAQADDGLSFSPWHGLAAHRPLGSINRARQGVYEHSAAFRGARTSCPFHKSGSRNLAT